MFASLPAYVTPLGRIQHVGFLLACVLIYLFLIAPLLVIIPLSFNAEPYFTFTEGMLRLDPDAYSLRWYAQVQADENWMKSMRNSFIIGSAATVLATALGTVAALGLSRERMPGRNAIMAVLLSPMIVPVIISASGIASGNLLVGIRGDPSLRETTNERKRHHSSVDEHIDAVIPNLLIHPY